MKQYTTLWAPALFLFIIGAALLLSGCNPAAPIHDDSAIQQCKTNLRYFENRGNCFVICSFKAWSGYRGGVAMTAVPCAR